MCVCVCVCVLQQKLSELNSRVTELTAELAEATETRRQMELDYSSKCDAFQSLSTEFQAAKVSFEVSCIFSIHGVTVTSLHILCSKACFNKISYQ